MLPSQLTFTQNQRNPESLKPELYNIWNFAKITNETQHPGNIPKEIIENLLYYYPNHSMWFMIRWQAGGSTPLLF